MSRKNNFAKGSYRPLRAGSLMEAVNNLVTAVGGQRIAAEILGVHQSQLSTWMREGERTTLDVIRVLTLERIAGEPIVTRYLASQHGARLDWGKADQSAIPEATARLILDAGRINADVITRLDDGVIDPAEAEELLQQLEPADRDIATLRLRLSEIAAQSDAGGEGDE